MKLTQKIADNKALVKAGASKKLIQPPKEAIADAIIDGGAETDLEEVAHKLGLPEDVVTRFVESPEFEKYLQRRYIQRGFDAVKFQESVNEISYMITKEIKRKLLKPGVIKKKSEGKLLGMMNLLQKISKSRAQTDAINKITYENVPRLGDPQEAFSRMMRSARGRMFIEKMIQQAEEEKAKIIDVEVISDEPSPSKPIMKQSALEAPKFVEDDKEFEDEKWVKEEEWVEEDGSEYPE